MTMATMETMEKHEMEFAHHHDYVCGECGTSMNKPHDWYMNMCDRCLNESAE